MGAQIKCKNCGFYNDEADSICMLCGSSLIIDEKENNSKKIKPIINAKKEVGEKSIEGDLKSINSSMDTNVFDSSFSINNTIENKDTISFESGMKNEDKKIDNQFSQVNENHLEETNEKEVVDDNDLISNDQSEEKTSENINNKVESDTINNSEQIWEKLLSQDKKNNEQKNGSLNTTRTGLSVKTGMFENSKNKMVMIAIPIFVVILLFAVYSGMKSKKYAKACEYYHNGYYIQAADIFSGLSNYKDSDYLYNYCLSNGFKDIKYECVNYTLKNDNLKSSELSYVDSNITNHDSKNKVLTLCLTFKNSMATYEVTKDFKYEYKSKGINILSSNTKYENVEITGSIQESVLNNLLNKVCKDIGGKYYLYDINAYFKFNDSQYEIIFAVLDEVFLKQYKSTAYNLRGYRVYATYDIKTNSFTCQSYAYIGNHLKYRDIHTTDLRYRSAPTTKGEHIGWVSHGEIINVYTIMFSSQNNVNEKSTNFFDWLKVDSSNEIWVANNPSSAFFEIMKNQ